MKWPVLLCALLFIAGCMPYMSTKASREEEYIVRMILLRQDYFLVSDTVYYHGVSYYRARYVYGIANNRNGVPGYFVMDKENQFKPTVQWKENGEMFEGPDIW